MSEQISSLDKPITLADWHEIYQRLLPYLGGNKAVDGNPIGTVITHLGATPPAGYLVCDGSKLSATAFPLLFDVLKELPSATRTAWGDADWVTEFNVPNLYGEFPRFSGTNEHANQGSGANVGVHQDGSAFPFMRVDKDNNFISIACGDIGSYPTNLDKAYSVKTGRFVLNKELNASLDSTLYSVRPTNTSFLPCIKYTYVTQEVEYSEQERVVGKWIDGSDLYEKTYSLQNNYALPTNEWVVVSEISLPLSIGLITNCDTISVQTNGVYKIPYWAGISNGQLVLENTRSTLSGFGPNGDNILEGYITIRYTKTQ